jgi:hypothetical protein
VNDKLLSLIDSTSVSDVLLMMFILITLSQVIPNAELHGFLVLSDDVKKCFGADWRPTQPFMQCGADKTALAARRLSDATRHFATQQSILLITSLVIAVIFLFSSRAHLVVKTAFAVIVGYILFFRFSVIV